MLTMTEPKMGVILSFNSIKRHRFIGWYTNGSKTVEVDELMTKAEAVVFFADFIFPNTEVELDEWRDSAVITINSLWSDLEVRCDSIDVLIGVVSELERMKARFKAKTPQVLS